MRPGRHSRKEGVSGVAEFSGRLYTFLSYVSPYYFASLNSFRLFLSPWVLLSQVVLQPPLQERQPGNKTA